MGSTRKGSGVTTRTMTRRILAWYDKATPEQIAAGAAWYGDGYRTIVNMAASTGQDVEHVAIAVALLSPQTRWSANVDAAWALLTFDERMPAMLWANFDRARQSLTMADPWEAFGPTAPKTRSFARNLLGDTDAVTIDVWAARAALQGMRYKFRDGMEQENAKILKRAGVYSQISDAYRAAARQRGITAPAMQAIVWTVIRRSAD
jgi:hypothetical protein